MAQKSQVFEVEVNGQTFEVEAPSIDDAYKAALEYKPEQPIKTEVTDIDADTATSQALSMPSPGVMSVAGKVAGDVLGSEPLRRGTRIAASKIIGGGLERSAQVLPRVLGGPAGATVGARI